MASVDSQDPLIHPPVKQEDPDMKYTIETLKLLVSIQRPYVWLLSKWHIEDQDLQVRVKHLDEVVQKVFQEVQPLVPSNPTDVVQGNKDWESSPMNVADAVSILKILRSLVDEMCDIGDLLPNDSSASITSENVEQLVRFIDSLLQNLKDVVICRANSVVLLKKVLEDAKDRLILLRNFLWPISNRLTEQTNIFAVFECAKALAFKTSLLLYCVCLLNDELNDEWLSNTRDVFPILTDSIDNALIGGPVIFVMNIWSH
ncbi:hypothetical protein ACH5RR_034422 [Cinchona calisaya]|uniref:Uncharacterized protein n=1 Tax=Cinchona calisaya TaxID=153742 RepID=A0ABD2YD17_9GENT